MDWIFRHTGYSSRIIIQMLTLNIHWYLYFFIHQHSEWHVKLPLCCKVNPSLYTDAVLLFSMFVYAAAMEYRNFTRGERRSRTAWTSLGESLLCTNWHWATDQEAKQPIGDTKGSTHLSCPTQRGKADICSPLRQTDQQNDLQVWKTQQEGAEKYWCVSGYFYITISSQRIECLLAHRKLYVNMLAYQRTVIALHITLHCSKAWLPRSTTTPNYWPLLKGENRQKQHDDGKQWPQQKRKSTQVYFRQNSITHDQNSSLWLTSRKQVCLSRTQKVPGWYLS